MQAPRQAHGGDGPIRVLLWSPKGAGLHYGGPGMNAFRMYSSAAAGRFRITLVHGSEVQRDYDLIEQHHFLSPTTMRASDQLLFLHKAKGWIRRHAGDFDVFHGVESFQSSVLPAAWAQRRGLPGIVRVAGHLTDLADKPGLRSLLGLPRRRRRLISGLGGVVAISRDIADELAGYGIPREKIFHIPNGVNTVEFRPASPEERRAARAGLDLPEAGVVVFVGGMTPRKRPHLLVEAMAAIVAGGVHAHLVLAGPVHDAAYHAAMVARVEKLGLSQRVTWLEFAENIASVYRAGDLYCLPSVSEGMPNALLEAMASGLPAVVTAISGINDIVRDGVDGCFVEPTADSVAEALRAYLADEGRRADHAAAARERMVESFSVASVVDKYEAVFRGLIAGAGPDP